MMMGLESQAMLLATGGDIEDGSVNKFSLF